MYTFVKLQISEYQTVLFFSDLKWTFCRFEGPRGPRFEPPLRFSGPPRFDGQRFGMPPRGNHTRPGPPGRFENPLRQNPPSHFERPPGPHLGPPTGPPPPSCSASQAKPCPVNQTNSQLGTPDSSHGSLPQNMTIDKNENKTLQTGTEEKSMSDDVMDSDDGFFVQSDPIPQSQADIGKKVETVRQTAKEEESKNDTAKTSVSTSSTTLVPPKQPPTTGNKIPEAPENINAPQQRPQPSQQTPFQSDLPKESPGKPHEMNPSGPPHAHALRGRGRGQGPLPMRGRGRGHGHGQISRPRGLPSMSDPNYHGEDAPYEHQPPMEEDYGWGNHSQEPHGMMNEQEAHEMWQPEEHHFQKEYCEETEEPQEPQEHWEEEQSECWEEGDSYWTERRPPMMHHRPPFPPEGPRHPPFQPRFMHHGPRRPPPPLDMERGPPSHMGPRFRRGGPGPWGPPPHHDMMRRPPPPPHELLEREPMGPPGYHDEMNRDPGWSHPHGREPRHPHELIERDMRRPPMRPHPMARDRWRRPPHEEPQETYEQEYGTEFGPEDDGYGRAPPDHRHQDYREEDEFYPPREEFRRDRQDCDFPPHPQRGPPPDHLRDDPWRDERDRPFSYENEDRVRPERRGPGYADGPLYRDRDREPPFHSRPDWERPPPPPLPERVYPNPTEATRPPYDRNPELPMAPQSGVPEAPLDQMSPGGTKTVLALSQRQHEIILKAAQELKMIRYIYTVAGYTLPCYVELVALIIVLLSFLKNRELQESKKVLGDASIPESTGLPPEIPAGLLGLEIPPEVKTALQVSP